MNNWKLAVIAAALLAGSATSVNAQTADEIVQKHIAAIGGADNWNKINSIKCSGSVNAQGMEIPVTVTTVKGKAERTEFTINGMTCYMILTQKDGWVYYPIQGQTKPEAIPEEMVKQEQNELDLSGALVDYNAKGNKVAYLGKDDVEGTDCYKLKVTYPTGKEETVYLDASNYYHIRSVTKVKANGKEEEQTINFSNYQKLPEGIVFPMTIDQGMGAVVMKTVEINKPVDESIFKPAATGGTDAGK